MGICNRCEPITMDIITGEDVYPCEVEPYNCPMQDIRGMINCIRSAYPWAKYIARNDEGNLSLHESKPYYINGGMRPTGTHYMTLPSELFDNIKRGEYCLL